MGAALAACAVPPNPAFDASRAHHRPTGFQNNYVEFEPKNFFVDVLLRWKLPAWLEGLPPPPKAAAPTRVPDLAFLHANGGTNGNVPVRPSVTFIGHATTLVQLPDGNGGAINLLTDPHFGQRASPLSFAGPARAQPPGVALDDLPRIDVVVLSHNHYDHLDESSMRALASRRGGSPLFLVPLGLKTWLAERGVDNAIELDWWDAVVLPAPASPAAPPRATAVGLERAGSASHSAPGEATRLVLTPVQHWSGRGLNDRMQTLWGGWAVFAPGMHLFFAGDTGYSRDFADIRRRLTAGPEGGDGRGFDLALIPIGAYEPRWFMRQQHVNPEEAVRVHRDLAARQSLGIHWGTFELTDEALDQPPRDLAVARRAQDVADDAFFTLAIGETRVLAPRQ